MLPVVLGGVVVDDWLVAKAKAQEVNGVHAVRLGQGGDVVAVVVGTGTKAVDENERGALGTVLHVVDVVDPNSLAPAPCVPATLGIF